MASRIFLSIFICLFLNRSIIYPEEQWPYQLYRANLHIHSSFSEKARHFGSLSKISTVEKPITYYDHILAEKPSKTCQKAKSIGLNIVGFSDHDLAMTSQDWQDLESIFQNNRSGNFLAFRGFEWTPNGHSHINILGTKRFVSARAQFVNYGLVGIDKEIKIIPNLGDFYNWVCQECQENPYVVGQYNHPCDAEDKFNNFSVSAGVDDFMALMELGSGPDLRYLSIEDNINYYILALQKGRWLAPTIGIDNFGPITKKEARERCTIIWLENGAPLNETNVISALLQRKTCSSEDNNIDPRTWAKCESNNAMYFPGDKLEIKRGQDLSIFAEIYESNESIGEIKIVEVRHDKKIETYFSPETKHVTGSYYRGKKICHPSSETICYLLLIKEPDGEMVICSPIGVNVTVPEVIKQYEYKGDDALEMLYHADDFKYKLIICNSYYKDMDGELHCSEKDIFSYDNDNIHIIAQPKNLTQKYKLPCQLKVLLYNTKSGELVEKHVINVARFPQKDLLATPKLPRLPRGKYFAEGYVDNDLWARKYFQVK